MSPTRIVVVEDERIVARDIQNRLTRLGYEVVGTTWTGEEAIRLAELLRPELVLMDIRLEGAVDGVAAAQEIRTRFQLPVVYLTAYADDDTLQRARVTEPFGYILKPFDERELRTVIEMALFKHQAEQKLRESERRYAVTLSSIGDAVIATDAQARITFMNPAASELTGWPQAEAAGQPLAEVFRIVNEETRQPVENPAVKVLRLGTVVGLANHTVLLARGGGEVPIDDCGAPIIDDSSAVAGAVLVFHDVTEQRRADEVLRRSEERYRQLFESNPHSMWVFDAETLRFLAVNAAAVERYGYSREEFLAMTIAEIRPPEDVPALLKRLGGGLADDVQPGMAWRHRWKDGTVREVDVSSHALVYGGRPARLVLALDITDRRRAEAESQRIAGLLQAVADETTDAVFVKNLAGKYLLFNQAASRFVGKPVAEVLGKDDTELFEPESARAVMDRDRQIMAAGVPETEEETLTAAGVTRTYHATKAPYRDRSGTIVGLIGISRDVTGRKRAEDALRESEQRFRTFVDHATDAFFLHDDRGAILDVNQRACEALGYTRDELIGMSPADVDQDATPAQFGEISRRLDAGETLAIDSRHRRKDGSVFPVEVRLRPFWLGDRRFGVAIVRDITDRKRAENALRRSEEMLRRAQAIAHVGSWTFEVSGGVFLASEEGNRIYGWGSGPRRAEELLAIVHPDDLPRMQAAWHATLAGAPFEIEHRLVVRDQISWVNVRAEPETDDAGRVVRITGVTQDVTERRRLEEQFRQSQKMEAVGQLAGGIAHDFNNLLTVINACADLLAESVPPAQARGAALVADIRSAVQKAAALTGHLLTFSRKTDVTISDVNLNDVVTETTRLLRRVIGENIRVEMRLGADLPAVRAEPGLLHQVIMNLAVNAKDAMPDGGTLAIETSLVAGADPDRPTDPPSETRTFVRLTVSDTGCGMDDRTQARVFEPFFTTKEIGKGTGLGLATVYGIVRALNGKVRVSSAVGRGSTFHIDLRPHDESSSDSAAPETADPPVRLDGVTILLVEDNDMVREILVQGLTDDGAAVVPAARADAALRLLDADLGRIDILVTDVRMPGMSGRELAEKVRARRPDIKVVFMSGYIADPTLRPGLQEGIALLQKPFGPKALAQVVRQVLDSADPPPN